MLPLLFALLHPTVAVAQDGASPAFQLAWSGNTGGLASGQARFALHERLGTGGAPALSDIRPVHGWLVQGPWRLAASTRRIAETLTLVQGASPVCVAPRPVSVLSTDNEILIFDGEAPIWTSFWPARREVATRWTCSAGGVTADLLGPEGQEASPEWPLGGWDVRVGLEWTLEGGQRIDSIARPRGDGPHRAALLTSVVAESDIYLEAGSFVDGASSVSETGLSLHRDTGFALLARLGPDAMAPGTTELVGGIKALLRDAPDVPWVASNWRSKDPALALPDHRIVEVQGPAGTLRVGVVSALDPALALRNLRLKEEGITLAPPVTAVQEVVDRLAEGDTRLDLVVLLTTAGPELRSTLRRELRGIDLMIGDADASLAGVQSLDVRLQDQGRDGTYVLPLDPVLQANATLQPSGGLAALEIRPTDVTSNVVPDPQVLAAVTRVRARVYPALDEPLLPAPTGPPGTALQDATFQRLVCEAVLDETGADLVFLPTLKTGRGVPGPLTELLVADRLALTDVLEVHQVPGDRLRAMSERLYAGAPNHCGGKIGNGSATVGRRGIEPDQVYRIVTTDRLRATTVLDTLLQGARAPGVLDRPGYRVLTGAKGAPSTLRATALGALQRLRDAYGAALIEELTGRDKKPADPRWLLRIRGVSVRIEGFQGVGDEAYAQVPETLATSPSSFTLGTAADVALDYAARRVGWDVRLRHAYTRLRTSEQVQETADDVKLSSSVNLPGLSTPAVAGVAFRPYSEGLFDSEWTPVEPTDGVEVPRQADLSLTVGLQATPKGWLRTLRLGMLVNQDLAVPDKQAELGGRVEAQLSVPLGSTLKFNHQIDAFVYGNTPDQDASDLRFKGKLDSRLGLPLIHGLNVSLYGSTFVFQGRVPETQAVRASFSLGASLDVGGVFAL